ncbi:MAG: MFS transporter [Shinella sp.]|nr:MFS transporter [Shinella sp.]
MPLLQAIVILSLTQVIAWGTMFMSVSVLGDAMAADLGMEAAEIYLGASVMLVAMALASPLTARLYRRHGPRQVLAAGAVLSVPGFFLLASCETPVSYYLGWAMLGLAGAGALTTSAHAYLAEYAGSEAKRAIGAQMLGMALAPTLSWPITAFLQEACGWRATFVIFAAAMLFVVVPLTLFGLRPTGPGATSDVVGTAAAGPLPSNRYWLVMVLITAAVALNGFVTWGFQLVIIDIFRSYSVAEYLAVGFASAIGIVQMSARLIDFWGGNRWDGLSTGLAAGLLMPVALLTLVAGGGAEWAIILFLLLYGLSSGAMAVSRATLPLAFFDRRTYATVVARVALPLNLAFAAAPPLFSHILQQYGNRTALSVALVLSLGTLASLALLRGLRPEEPIVHG